MSVEELEEHLQRHWPKIRAKLLSGAYVPSPVKRVLGIPTVQDRFIQQLLLQVMTPIYEPGFSEQSYGFRPGRECA
jgi:retron-type reverse transcriptase